MFRECGLKFDFSTSKGEGGGAYHSIGVIWWQLSSTAIENLVSVCFDLHTIKRMTLDFFWTDASSSIKYTLVTASMWRTLTYVLRRFLNLPSVPQQSLPKKMRSRVPIFIFLLLLLLTSSPCLAAVWSYGVTMVSSLGSSSQAVQASKNRNQNQSNWIWRNIWKFPPFQISIKMNTPFIARFKQNQI